MFVCLFVWGYVMLISTYKALISHAFYPSDAPGLIQSHCSRYIQSSPKNQERSEKVPRPGKQLAVTLVRTPNTTNFLVRGRRPFPLGTGSVSNIVRKNPWRFLEAVRGVFRFRKSTISKASIPTTDSGTSTLETVVPSKLSHYQHHPL